MREETFNNVIRVEKGLVSLTAFTHCEHPTQPIRYTRYELRVKGYVIAGLTTNEELGDLFQVMEMMKVGVSR